MELSGSSAVVTGAASGLGAAVSRELAARGMRVIGIDLEASIQRAGEAATAAAAPAVAPERDGHVSLVAADVTDPDQVAAALATLDADYPLRLAVNCAGIAPASRVLTRGGPHDLDLFRRVIDVNLIGTFNVLRLAAEVMAAQQPADADGQHGVIVNTASIAAYEGQVGQVAYAASKGAVVSMTLAAARDLARHGIRVNTIAPGVVETPMLAGLDSEVSQALAAAVPYPPRLARPDEFARLVTMIAEHDYLNGETIRMDGALRMGPR